MPIRPGWARQSDVLPGDALHIPGRAPHRSLADAYDLFCLNIYLLPDTYEIGGLLSALRFLYRKRRIILRPEVEAAIARYCSAAAKRPPAGRPPIAPGDTVAHTALLAGRSREGVSRWFKKIHGLPPQAFQILSRLNHARTLLRSGASPVIASVEAGFADQSHMAAISSVFSASRPAVTARDKPITSVLEIVPRLPVCFLQGVGSRQPYSGYGSYFYFATVEEEIMDNLSGFCTCSNFDCPLHPTKHNKGCAPCAQKT